MQSRHARGNKSAERRCTGAALSRARKWSWRGHASLGRLSAYGSVPDRPRIFTNTAGRARMDGKPPSNTTRHDAPAAQPRLCAFTCAHERPDGAPHVRLLPAPIVAGDQLPCALRAGAGGVWLGHLCPCHAPAHLLQCVSAPAPAPPLPCRSSAPSLTGRCRGRSSRLPCARATLAHVVWAMHLH